MMRRSGVVLLETLVAITVFALSSAALVSLLAAAVASDGHRRASLEQVENAAELLDIVSVWSRGDIAAHLGTRHEGALDLTLTLVRTDVVRAQVVAPSSGASLLDTYIYFRQGLSDSH